MYNMVPTGKIFPVGINLYIPVKISLPKYINMLKKLARKRFF